MSMFTPIEKLAAMDAERVASAQALGEAYEGLAVAIEAYKGAWRRAKSAGRTNAELTRAGLVDPAKLPRVKSSGGEAEEDSYI